jgi:hypothetical protein
VLHALSPSYHRREGRIARRAYQAVRRVDEPRRRIIRKEWPGYVALYKSKGGEKLIVRSLTPPPEVRTFKVAGGLRKFKRVKYRFHLQEVIIVAKAATKKKKNPKSNEITDDELDELEGVEDLDDLDEEEEEEEVEEDEDDEEEPEDEDDDEDEDEEEEEAPKSKKKSKKPKQSQAAKNGKVGTAEVAEYCGIESRALRMVLREHEIPKDEESGRYEWPSLKSKQVQKIKKLIDSGEAKKIQQRSLDKLKERKAAEKKAKANDPKAKTKKTKKKKKAVEDDDE